VKGVARVRGALWAGRKLGRKYHTSSLAAMHQYWRLVQRASIDHAHQRAEQRSCKFLGREIQYFGDRELLVLVEEIFLSGLYEFQSPTNTPVIFDCGSNIGLSVLFFKLLYPDSRIVAFEPSSESFRLLEENTSRNNLSDVVLHNCALVGESRPVELFVSDDRPASLRASMFQERTAGVPRGIPGKTLSEFIDRRVNFVKIDIEGAEEQVLKELITSGKIEMIEQMVIEYHHQISPHQKGLAQFLTILEQAGFRYRLAANSEPGTSAFDWQDVMIFAARRAHFH
jgi:FkbM family methyltransferase